MIIGNNGVHYRNNVRMGAPEGASSLKGFSPNPSNGGAYPTTVSSISWSTGQQRRRMIRIKAMKRKCLHNLPLVLLFVGILLCCFILGWLVFLFMEANHRGSKRNNDAISMRQYYADRFRRRGGLNAETGGGLSPYASQWRNRWAAAGGMRFPRQPYNITLQKFHTTTTIITTTLIQNDTISQEQQAQSQPQPMQYSVNNSIIPFVIMVYKRVDYMKQVMDSLLASDFPRDRVPVIISHDGRVPEMIDYVESLKEQAQQNNKNNPDKSNNEGLFRIITLIHPHSCYEHPHSFPGNDSSLNRDYQGDTYGNPRSDWATCCKHHFTWMINTVFELEELQQDVDTFFFLEEDYVVAKTIYTSIVAGLNVMARTENFTTNGYFGLAMNASNSVTPAAQLPISPLSFEWTVLPFRSGPMTMNRNLFALLKQHSIEYCTRYDDYNWDWTLYHLMRDQYIPYTVLSPYRVPLVQHIGTVGMHTVHANSKDLIVRKMVRGYDANQNTDLMQFLASLYIPTNRTMQERMGQGGNLQIRFPMRHKLSGGWNHPADHQHCLTLFNSSLVGRQDMSSVSQ